MGIALYKENGDPLNMKITIDKIYLMSKGEPAEVGIDFNSLLGKRFVDDICEDGFEDHSRAIIHSHQNLAISPSGTDLQQVVQWAQSHPYYLSLIVNNKFEFNALLAIKTEKTVTTISKVQKLNRKYFKPSISKETIVDYDIYYPTIIVPKIIATMAERIKSVQNYTSVPTYTPSYKGVTTYHANENKKVGFGNYDKKNWEHEWESYSSKEYPNNPKGKQVVNSWKPKETITPPLKQGNSMPTSSPGATVGKQITMAFGEHDDYPDSLVESVLVAYCFAASDKREQPYTPKECFEHINLDIFGHGIPNHVYASYIKRKKIFYNKIANEELYDLLVTPNLIFNY